MRVGKRFLYELDAMFLTSSSIIAGHFDPYRLLTPYWAGFLVYHVERDLARGLLLTGQRH
ncbi:MAG: hypothetical protein QN174_03925 [Armatimonadota bacterium]|nr:hypothetical protein [Armatimonadota bacterium]MDR7421160.1 hypothetical protein [Armatimonadota bacterium]MDR7453476.1 hypothetical protein [Armatimonadota bacterium]MDR7457257.1 hypothetical protein [Armatimonadota bacterium]MDR7496094.1 hypothetical protein [Armatimonadota bacterium]